MISDTDWILLQENLCGINRRIEEIERSLRILQAYVDTSLKEADTDVSSAYVLSSGSLVDAGISQVWGQPKALVDCISTTKIGGGNV